MGADPRTVNKRTAMVYAGAAILIVVVGIRTILQTSDDGGFTSIAYITMSALGLEFFLLLLYAYTIYSQDVVEGPKGVTSSININLDPITSKLENIVKSNNELKASTESLLHELTNNRSVMLEHSESIAELGNTLESIVDGEVNRRIKDEIQKILSSMVSPK